MGHRLSLDRGHRAARTALVAGALATTAISLMLAGCGRRGPLEPPPGLAGAPAVTGANRPLAGNGQDLSEGGIQDTGDPGLIQSPNTVYERSAIAKLNSATAAPPPRPINAPPAAQPSTFFLDPLVK